MTDPERMARNNTIIETFRANGGVVRGLGLPEHVPLLLLTTVGARTGEPRTSALGYLPDGDRWIVFAANGGRPNRPNWYHNLMAHPNATIEVGTDTIDVRATVVEGQARQPLWERMAAAIPMIETFQEKVSWVIPVIALTRGQD